MARKILISSHVSALMKDFYESEAELIYGLVLGHFDNKDVMVVHLARTPHEGSEDEESDDSKVIKKHEKQLSINKASDHLLVP